MKLGEAEDEVEENIEILDDIDDVEQPYIPFSLVFDEVEHQQHQAATAIQASFRGFSRRKQSIVEHPIMVNHTRLSVSESKSESESTSLQQQYQLNVATIKQLQLRKTELARDSEKLYAQIVMQKKGRKKKKSESSSDKRKSRPKHTCLNSSNLSGHVPKRTATTKDIDQAKSELKRLKKQHDAYKTGSHAKHKDLVELRNIVTERRLACQEIQKENKSVKKMIALQRKALESFCPMEAGAETEARAKTETKSKDKSTGKDKSKGKGSCDERLSQQIQRKQKQVLKIKLELKQHAVVFQQQIGTQLGLIEHEQLRQLQEEHHVLLEILRQCDLADPRHLEKRLVQLEQDHEIAVKARQELEEEEESSQSQQQQKQQSQVQMWKQKYHELHQVQLQMREWVQILQKKYNHMSKSKTNHMLMHQLKVSTCGPATGGFSQPRRTPRELRTSEGNSTYRRPSRPKDGSSFSGLLTGRRAKQS